MINAIKKSYLDAIDTLQHFYNQSEEIIKTENTAKIIAESFRNGGKIITAGNGGSLCDSMHLAEEFTGRFRKNRPALPAIALADSSHITCVGNDFGFEDIFSRGIEAFGKKGDIFVGLSTSGNSANIIKAIESAKKCKMKTILLLGKDGGKLKNCADIEFIISGETSDRIQEVHMVILHTIIEMVERILFPENY